MAKNHKIKNKLNAFDIAVILLLIALVATVLYQMFVTVSETNSQSRAKYIMEFECEEEYDSLLRYVKEGDAVYFANGSLLGFMYANEDYENGAIYTIVDDIPSFADAPETEDSDVEGSEEESSEIENSDGQQTLNNSINIDVQEQPDVFYNLIKLGGQIKLNVNTVRYKSGDYYTIGDTNITEGSVINVYTDKTEFTLKIVNITIVEE